LRSRLFLIDASAFWRLGRSELDPERRREVAGWVSKGMVAASTPLLLETRAGKVEPAADPSDLPLLWIRERAERRAAELQQQMRAAHQHLGIPPLEYLIAAIAEDHSASILHYDSDFELLLAHTDLAADTEPLAEIGSIP
jgi:predicted nucleic acid-binding protein